MQPRRQQPVITIRSERARRRLHVLARNGRSQAQIIEEALDRMPDPPVEEDARKAALRARIDDITSRLSKRDLPIMAEFDAAEYDENGFSR